MQLSCRQVRGSLSWWSEAAGVSRDRKVPKGRRVCLKFSMEQATRQIPRACITKHYSTRYKEQLWLISILSSATAALAISTSLGNKSTIALGALGAGTPSGRKTTVPAITDGAGTANGTATHYAVINPTGPVLVATGALTASKVIANGDVFTLAAFDLTILAAT